MAGVGLRVLAFAHGPIDNGLPAEERGLILSGLVGLEDPPRPEVPEAIARCGTAGIRVIMVTGDHPHTAQAIAREIGLLKTGQPVVITGDELSRLSPAQLQLALDAPEILFARVAAVQKMQLVEALQKKGEIVAVTGDGVNDAPALKAADIGIAMGVSGTDVAKEAADMILLDDNFASIVSAIEEGRSVFDNPPRQNSCRLYRSTLGAAMKDGLARYGQTFKDRAVARLLPPESAAIDVVAREVGIGTGTLGAGARMRGPGPPEGGPGPRPAGLRQW